MLKKVQFLVAPLAALWWIFLALLSRIDISALQLKWNFESSFAIFFYFPFCIVLGSLGVKFAKSNKLSTEESSNSFINILFFLFMAIFFFQWIKQLPPIFASDPSEARLIWGIKIIHLITEVVIRTTVILTVANIFLRKKITKIELLIIFLSLLYAFCVVSRGLILEMLFYIGITSFLIRVQKGRLGKTLVHFLFLTFIGLIFFVLYGQWRQGNEFSIVGYGQVKYDNSAIAWFFGYFLVNFDNLALIIMREYHNYSLTNVFGPLLQSLQIVNYIELNDYPYVGAFNLGTEFRPYIIDYGTWLGGGIFAFIWSLLLASPAYSTSIKGRWSILLLLLYMGICLPITNRLLNPPYLFSLLLIILLDHIRFSTIKRVFGQKND